MLPASMYTHTKTLTHTLYFSLYREIYGYPWNMHLSDLVEESYLRGVNSRKGMCGKG